LFNVDGRTKGTDTANSIGALRLVTIPTGPCITYQGNSNTTALKIYAVENMHSIFKKVLCVKIVDTSLALLEA
jgi:hypothetical protein